MRKRLLRILVLMLFGVCIPSEASIFEVFPPFKPNEVEITWAINSVPTNRLKVFDTVSRNFDTHAVSNLLAWAELTEADRTPLRGGRKDSDAVYFVSQKSRSSLLIMPSEGFVTLKVRTPDKHRQEGDLVPEMDQVVDRGSNILATVFGIGSNELAYKKPGQPYVTYTVGTLDSLNNSKKRIKAVITRGVHFYRRIEGHTVLGAGGATIKVVDDGKINELEFIWRSLKFNHDLPAPSLDDLKQAISKGLARWDPGSIVPSKLVFEDVDFCYEEFPQAERQTTFYPFARVIATGYDSRTNAPVYLFCPIALDRK